MPWHNPPPPKKSIQEKAKQLMAKANQNKQKSIFRQAVEQKFKEYDQKLEALSSINVPEAIKKAVQAKVMIEMNKQLPTYVPTAISKFIKHRLNKTVLEDPPNNHEGETRKKRRKEVDEPSLRSSKKNKALVVPFQEDTLADQPKTKKKITFRNVPMQGGLIRSRGSAEAAKKKTTWFDMLFKRAYHTNLEGVGLEKLKKQYKNDVELEYHVDQLKVTVLTEAQWSNDEGDVSKPRSFDKHMSKSTKPHNFFYNNDFYYLVNLSTGEKYAASLTKHFAARYRIQVTPSDIQHSAAYTDLRVLQIGIRAKVIENQGADDEEISEGGIPRVIVLGYDGLPLQPVALPSPDYIPGPKDPQTPLVPQDEDEHEPMFVQAHDPDYVLEPIYPEYIPLEDEHEFPAEEQPLPLVDSPTAESPRYVIESDPEEDPEEYEDDETKDSPVDYPMDRGDDGDDDDGDSPRDDAKDEDEKDEDEEEEEEHLASADSAI
ncbi:hypothetical protein Tco_0832499, partial [Tanacetum coccineum]